MQPEIQYFSVNETDNELDIDSLISGFYLLKEGFFTFIDSNSAKTKKQINEAYIRSLRIYEESAGITRPESVFLMLISGESQISRAIIKSGISSDTRSGYVVFDHMSDLVRLKSMYPGLFDFREQIDLPDDDRSLDRTIFFSMLKVQLKMGR